MPPIQVTGGKRAVLCSDSETLEVVAGWDSALSRNISPEPGMNAYSWRVTTNTTDIAWTATLALDDGSASTVLATGQFGSLTGSVTFNTGNVTLTVTNDADGSILATSSCQNICS